MLNSICDKKGITMVEVLVSVVLICVGVLGLLTLLPSGLKLMGTSDLLGRATGILHSELEMNGIRIMNANNAISPTVPGVPDIKVVYGSGKSSPQPGDVAYSLETERIDLGGTWRVRVRVTWPGNTRGIAESLIVARQAKFAQ